MTDRLLKPREVAELLQIGYRAVHELRKAGELPARAVAGTWRFHPDDIDDYIERTKTHA